MNRAESEKQPQQTKAGEQFREDRNSTTADRTFHCQDQLLSCGNLCSGSRLPFASPTYSLTSNTATSLRSVACLALNLHLFWRGVGRGRKTDSMFPSKAHCAKGGKISILFKPKTFSLLPSSNVILWPLKAVHLSRRLRRKETSSLRKNVRQRPTSCYLALVSMQSTMVDYLQYCPAFFSGA